MRKREDQLIVLFFAVISVLFLWPLYQHLDYWGILDWDAFLFRNSVSRDSLVEFGQLPLWNPYSQGGLPHLAHPETNVFSLPFLIDLIFGVFLGVRISMVLHLFLGLTGMFCLARHLGLERPAAVLTACIAMLNGMYVCFLATGTTSIGLAIGYMPWALCFFLKSLDDRRQVGGAALCLALMWLQGGTYNFFLVLLFMGIYLAVTVATGKTGPGKAAFILAGTAGGAILLAAVRFLPALEFSLQYPRHETIYSGFSVESLLYGLFGRDQTLAAILDKSRATGFWQGFTHDLDEIGMYIGMLPFLFFIVGVWKSWRQQAALAVGLLLFVWLAFGNRCEPLSLWALLNQLPPFSFMRTAERFRFGIMICLALFCGLGFQYLITVAARKFQQSKQIGLLAPALIALVLLDLFLVNSPVLRDGLSIPPLPTPRNQSFVQIGGFPAYDRNGIVKVQQEDYPLFRTLGAMYPAYLSNAGTVYSVESIPAPARAVIFSDPAYRGEVYLEGTAGRASYELWSPNRLQIRVEARGDGFVVVNQNYYPGWRVKGGLDCEEHNGLLAVRITPAVKNVELYYLPTSFVLGAITSLVALALLPFWFRR